MGELCNLEIRPTPGGRSRIAAAGGQYDDWRSALFGLLQAIEMPARPGIIGVWERLAEGPRPGNPPVPETGNPPEPPTARCRTMVREENAPHRCALELGHAGEHEPGEPIPA